MYQYFDFENKRVRDDDKAIVSFAIKHTRQHMFSRKMSDCLRARMSNNVISIIVYITQGGPDLAIANSLTQICCRSYLLAKI